MDTQSILRKMKFKEGMTGLVHGAPRDIELSFASTGFLSELAPVQGSAFRIVFVRDKVEFDSVFLRATKESGEEDILWIAYPKGGSRIPTDVNRDILWELAKPVGWRPVAQVSIDDDWSAMRFKPAAAVGRS